MKDFEQAKSIIEQYKLLRLDRKAKDAFDLHGKLTAVGYTESELLKEVDERYIQSQQFDVYNTDESTFLSTIDNMVKNSNCSVLFNKVKSDSIYHGSGDYNAAYCSENKINVLQLNHRGCTVLASIDDLVVTLHLKEKLRKDIVLEKIAEWINGNITKCEVKGSDIFIGDNIVVSSALRDNNVYNYIIYFNVNIAKVNGINTKPLVKQPKGLSSFGNGTDVELKNYITAWLQR